MKTENEPTATWKNEQLVRVFRGGLHIANVCHVPVDGGWRMGWKVFPLTTARKPSCTFSDDPATAIKKMYGKLVYIRQAEAL
jgi:hypothetical protein